MLIFLSNYKIQEEREFREGVVQTGMVLLVVPNFLSGMQKGLVQLDSDLGKKLIPSVRIIPI